MRCLQFYCRRSTFPENMGRARKKFNESKSLMKPQEARSHLDAGYSYEDVIGGVQERNDKLHFKKRGAELIEVPAEKNCAARRWVVERPHSWHNRFRRLLVRWEKKLDVKKEKDRAWAPLHICPCSIGSARSIYEEQRRRTAHHRHRADRATY